MTIVEKIPSLSDPHLANLLANARRMQSRGAGPHLAEADDVILAAEAETAVRHAAHREELAARRASAPKKRSAKRG